MAHFSSLRPWAAAAALIVLALAVSCQGPSSPGGGDRPFQEDLKAPRHLKIWPVGDSITAGASACWGIWSPENGGYRRNLMLLLNKGHTYEFLGGTTDDRPGGDLPAQHSGYRGEGLSVLSKPEAGPSAIAQAQPDAVLVLLGINSLGSKKEYPDAQGSEWSKSGRFNRFFLNEKLFIDRVLTQAPRSKVFLGLLPPIGDTRFYLQTWDEHHYPAGPWTTVGDGSVNPKDLVAEFNTELQAFVAEKYTGNPRVIVVDLFTGMKVGPDWTDDVCLAGDDQQWWNGDALHPTQTGYRHIAERWAAALEAAFPVDPSLLYSVDCGAPAAGTSLAAEGAVVGSLQSSVDDRPYGPDPVTGRSWGHEGEAGTDLWFAWSDAADVASSVATGMGGHDLEYRFEVTAGAPLRVSLGLHDTWGENADPKGTVRAADLFLNGTKAGHLTYSLGSWGRRIFEVTPQGTTLEVRLHGTSGDALLDSLAILAVR